MLLSPFAVSRSKGSQGMELEFRGVLRNPNAPCIARGRHSHRNSIFYSYASYHSADLLPQLEEGKSANRSLTLILRSKNKWCKLLLTEYQAGRLVLPEQGKRQAQKSSAQENQG